MAYIGPSPIFVNSGLSERRHICVCPVSACGRFCAVRPGLSRCDRDHMVPKAENTDWLALYRKRLTTSGLNYKSRTCILKKVIPAIWMNLIWSMPLCPLRLFVLC